MVVSAVVKGEDSRTGNRWAVRLRGVRHCQYLTKYCRLDLIVSRYPRE